MVADHNTLDALRRMAKDRAATPAEKATARRFAKALAAKIGDRPNGNRRKGSGAALPEPPAAMWRRRWMIRLESMLHKIAVAGPWVHRAWIVSFIAMVLNAVFGREAVRYQDQVGGICLVLTLGLTAAGLIMIVTVVLLAFAIWLLKTWRGERLRPALIFLTEQVPWFAMMAAYVGLSMYLEDHLKWPRLLASVATWPIIFALSIPWWRWVYPAIERALMRATNAALWAGVLVVAIAVILAAGGVWAAVYAR